MSFWCCAQLENGRAALALYCLKLSGFQVYAPRVRTYRFSHGRKVEERPLLFPNYAFLLVVVGWWQARWCPGIVRLVTAGRVARRTRSRRCARRASVPRPYPSGQNSELIQ
jgi:hypothetical protein